MEHIDKDHFFINVTKKMCPSVSVLADEELVFDKQSQMYL